MHFLKRIFSHNQHVAYSCVVDDAPLFYWQARIFILSLVHVAKISPQDIYVHATNNNISFDKFARDNGVNIFHIKKWGDEKYCNKLQQIETKELYKYQYVFLCDCDIAILDDIGYIGKNKKICAKTVDLDNPDIKTLSTLFDTFGLTHPKITHDTLNAQPTFDGNFNGGLYGIPGDQLKRFGLVWKKWARILLESEDVDRILEKKRIHIDQISFCMALEEMKLPYQKLDIEFNCPTHFDSNILQEKLSSPPKVLHYHSQINPIGLLKNTNHPLLDQSIHKINQTLQKHFDNEAFWNYRYSTNPQLGSGIGSRNEIAAYKLALLKQHLPDPINSLLDVGCGDLEIVKHLNILNYFGVDVSYEALAQGPKKISNGHFFHYSDDKESIPLAEIVLCFDVLIHQPTRLDYDNLIKLLVEKTTNTLILTGYNKIADKSYMCFYYENVADSLAKTNSFTSIEKIGQYHGVEVIAAKK